MLWIILIGIYIMPTIIAAVKGHSRLWDIVVINICLGWTGIGWIAALASAIWEK